MSSYQAGLFAGRDHHGATHVREGKSARTARRSEQAGAAMDVQTAVQGVSWTVPGAESPSRPAGLTVREIWLWANRPAGRERRTGGHDWMRR